MARFVHLSVLVREDVLHPDSIEFVCLFVCFFFSSSSSSSFFLCREVSEHTRPKRKPAKTVPFSLSVEFVSQGRCASA